MSNIFFFFYDVCVLHLKAAVDNALVNEGGLSFFFFSSLLTRVKLFRCICVCEGCCCFFFSFSLFVLRVNKPPAWRNKRKQLSCFSFLLLLFKFHFIRRLCSRWLFFSFFFFFVIVFLLGSTWVPERHSGALFTIIAACTHCESYVRLLSLLLHLFLL